MGRPPRTACVSEPMSRRSPSDWGSCWPIAPVSSPRPWPRARWRPSISSAGDAPRWHIISGADDIEQQRDGDFLSKDERYARSSEYVGLLRRLWTARAVRSRRDLLPLQGRLRVREAGCRSRISRSSSAARPTAPSRRPASTPTSTPCSARPWNRAREKIARVRAAAARHGRKIGFSLFVAANPCGDRGSRLGARRSYPGAHTRPARRARLTDFSGAPRSEGSARLLEAASRGERQRQAAVDRGARVNRRRRQHHQPGRHGRAGADALLDYYDLGITTFLVRGFDPLEDAIQYGRELIPLVREAVANRPARDAAA